MRFPLLLCACVLVLCCPALGLAAPHDPTPSAGLCALPSLGPAGGEMFGEAVSEPDGPGDDDGEAGEDLKESEDVKELKEGVEGRAAPAAAAPAPAPFSAAAFGPSRGPLLEEAYGDAIEVLGSDEECSEFFGGREAAGHVLRRLVGQLRDESIRDASIGIRMKGSYSTVYDIKSGARFRLFEQAAINRNGPFFRAANGSQQLPDCGSFPANTRGARAAMLLHELGHLMRGADGQWVLPNDGDDPGLVARNTARVEKSCGRSIRALGAADAGVASAGAGRGAARERR